MPNIKWCKICDDIGHTAFYCPKRANKSLKSIRQLKKFSKVHARWLTTKREWYKLNTPDHAGFYYCFYCGIALTKQETELDHKISRTRDPSLRYELSNIVPSCHRDNMAKGSLSADEYQIRLDTA